MHDCDNTGRAFSVHPDGESLYIHAAVDDLDRDRGNAGAGDRSAKMDPRSRASDATGCGNNASITRARKRERERERERNGKRQHLKSRARTLIPDSRNLYDLYSITRALERSYVTARFFRADPARGLFAATYTRARFVKLCEATRREARGRVRCLLYITHLILWL